jgi:single-strand DNA-binding protein
MNSVNLTGNLTKDPELKQFGETTVCKLRLAVSERAKENGEWVSKAMYFDVDVFGRTADNCATYLKRGSHIALTGRLKWREWTTDEGGKRQAVSIVANDVEFPSRKDEQAGTYQQSAPAAAAPAGDFNRGNFDPAKDPDFQEQTGDDDIPF